MKIAYVISAYKNPDHLSRLVHRLHTGPETRFAVHVDRKTDTSTYDTMRDALGDLDGVTFLSRHACHWGGFGHVQASLKGVREVRESGWDPDYAILLSGQDYPIKPNAYIRDFLHRGDGRSFFLQFPLPTDNWTHGGLDRFRRWHWRYRRAHVWLPLRRTLPFGLKPWGGSAYWIMSRTALRTVASFVESNPSYVQFFRHVDIPDELFFQTILLNSPEAERCVDFRLHYTEWSRSPAPAILTSEDYPHLVESSCLFARKFDPGVDEELLALIDAHLLAGTATPG
ncbi:MAG: beta-1,6-N-acetylglucosaminyltransferase [Gaiellaceae bacterium]